VRVIGLISGTSHDAIESAAVDLRLEGEALVADVMGRRSTPYETGLRKRLLEALPPARTTLEDVCILDTEIGRAFAAAAAAQVADLPRSAADLVCSHGQTVYHWVDGSRALGTLQLGQPAWIAERTGLPVVADLRPRDIAAGGQGAPLASILDVLLLGDPDVPTAALNLGGIANITVLRPGAAPIAYDTGPASALIDAAVVELTDGRESYDRDGAGARRGTVDPALLGRLLEEPYYRLPAPKTTGKELFNAAYLRAHVDGGATSLDDLLATLTALTVETVARELERHEVERVVASGGGTRNPALMDGLRERLPVVSQETFDDVAGVASEAKEAVMVALIGFLTVNGLAGAVASCTGAERGAILGSITPGEHPLVLPPPAGVAVRRLELRAGVER
jgi:anhydro-N-acetylmuramic acid kinase